MEELGVAIQPPGGAPLVLLRSESERTELTIWLVDYDGPVVNRAPTEHDKLRWVTAEESAGLRLADERYLPLLFQSLA